MAFPDAISDKAEKSGIRESRDEPLRRWEQAVALHQKMEDGVIAGIGVDLVNVEQMRGYVDDPVFLSYTFRQSEREYAFGRGDEAECLAGIFAAKEAITKALAPLAYDDGLDMREIEILHAEKGAPYPAEEGALSIFLHRHDIREVHISISHDGDYAVAFAVVES